METRSVRRRYPVGAEIGPGGASFRVWAPRRSAVSLVLRGDDAVELPLRPEGNGFFSAVTADARSGSLYAFRLDDEDRLYPDPASRFQPQGPHGPSQVIDAGDFSWTDRDWPGIKLSGQVIYELHIGTFSPAGTWNGAIDHLSDLVDVGITAVEVMPVAEFSGEFGWGYDGVALFAPTRLYGVPNDFRRFVDCAHSLGLGVILDVVYNHLGPDGNYLPAFSPSIFTDRYQNEWGEAINYDGDDCRPVREFMTANAACWIQEYHLDGLRLDATQSIHDSSSPHILAEITQAARDAAQGRSVIVVAENESQRIEHVQPRAAGGYAMDALWNDDLHHTAVVALTGRREAYYTDYCGTPQELISAAKRGYLYQGQWYEWQKQRRGTPSLGVAARHFITFLENHDQVANSGCGLRLHQLSSPSLYRAVTAYWLLMPGTPMLFQGQEFGSTRPFSYFADHHADLAPLVSAGRKQFLSQFPSLASSAMQERLPDPAARATFENCKLDWEERERHSAMVALHRDLLTLRRTDAVLSHETMQLDGAVLAAQAFVLRFFADGNADRLLLVNLGHDLPCSPAPEPLLAPPAGCEWKLAWSSDDPRYGGPGIADGHWNESWKLPAQATVLLRPQWRTPT